MIVATRSEQPLCDRLETVRAQGDAVAVRVTAMDCSHRASAVIAMPWPSLTAASLIARFLLVRGVRPSACRRASDRGPTDNDLSRPPVPADQSVDKLLQLPEAAVERGVGHSAVNRFK
jgi:hypothetical protein